MSPTSGDKLESRFESMRDRLYKSVRSTRLNASVEQTIPTVVVDGSCIRKARSEVEQRLIDKQMCLPKAPVWLQARTVMNMHTDIAPQAKTGDTVEVGRSKQQEDKDGEEQQKTT